MVENKMVLVGVTGSIGMGKTTVANMMRELGIPVHDADAVSHYLLESNKESMEAVAKMFPEVAEKNDDGSIFINREKLGHIVFMDKEKKKQLEAYLHPLVVKDRSDFLKRKKEEGFKIAVLDIPLLFETGRDKEVDVTICVSAPPETQKERVLSRHGMTSEKFDAIVSGQMKDKQKCLLSDYGIDSGQEMDAMQKQVEEVIRKIEAKELNIF
ncbi:MAG: dephospho-CoA kinase [Proteobacteria bacterium]|nr:dephospho-CoA kinase [Pseudomonadota bacterium]